MLKMEKELERFNKTSEKPYAIHASYGITSRVPGETESMQKDIFFLFGNIFLYQLCITVSETAVIDSDKRAPPAAVVVMQHRHNRDSGFHRRIHLRADRFGRGLQ